ncbi:hypothetical protein [Burkholderia sp. AU15512]|uniref:hypothetical protein n=1 Tax=Burkholderia sp. AU15512 TaxID=2015345 RepID=UPI0011814210|nr:hypothetical protein [Burkholderia sp. AU15512]
MASVLNDFQARQENQRKGRRVPDQHSIIRRRSTRRSARAREPGVTRLTNSGAGRQVGNTSTSVPLRRWGLARNAGNLFEARAKRGSFGERFTVVDAEAGLDGQRDRSPVFDELEWPVAAPWLVCETQ